MLNKGSHRITLKNIATIVSATTVSISAYLSIEMLFIWRKQQPGGMLGLLLWFMWGDGGISGGGCGRFFLPTAGCLRIWRV